MWIHFLVKCKPSKHLNEEEDDNYYRKVYKNMFYS